MCGMLKGLKGEIVSGEENVRGRRKGEQEGRENKKRGRRRKGVDEENCVDIIKKKREKGRRKRGAKRKEGYR